MPDSNQMFGKSSGDTPDFLFYLNSKISTAELQCRKHRKAGVGGGDNHRGPKSKLSVYVF